MVVSSIPVASATWVATAGVEFREITRRFVGRPGTARDSPEVNTWPRSGMPTAAVSTVPLTTSAMCTAQS